MQWFEVSNVDQIDSPALLIYPDRVTHNIETMLKMVYENPSRLRPHVKTYKMWEVVEMQMNRGITQFKCATIAEAEMLGQHKVPDVLLAYQPVGPKIDRFLSLQKKYPETSFSCLIDNLENGQLINAIAQSAGSRVSVYIDLDSGNHRTGIATEKAFDLFESLLGFDQLEVQGLHAYDGHLRDPDFELRKQACDRGFEPVRKLKNSILKQFNIDLPIIAGGSPAFPCHATRSDDVICSPGTLLLWDWGYEQIARELGFQWAALVLTRVISKIGNDRICLDLGHKAIASENPFPRVHFLNLNEGEQIGHSEEHLILQVKDNRIYQLGEPFYGVPYHICPTCALHQQAYVVRDNSWTENWEVIARNRILTI